MNFFVLYVLGYLFGLVGHLVSKVTKEELDEIEGKVYFIKQAFIIIAFGSLLYFTYFSVEFIFTLLILLVLLLFEIFNGIKWVDYLRLYGYLFLYALAFYVSLEYNVMWLIPLVIFSIVMENTYREFRRPDFFYSLGLLLILYSIML